MALTVVFQPPRFAESNLVSNQIRLQALAEMEGGGAVMAGSSMIARLDPTVVEEAAGEGFPVIQLGLDGGTVSLGLEIIGGGLGDPGVLVLEANLLLNQKSENHDFLLKQTSDPVFLLARYFPPVRAKNRPSAFLYSRLKEWKDGRGASGVPEGLDGEVEFGIFSGDIEEAGPEIAREADRVIALVEESGVGWENVLFVMLPDGEWSRRSNYQCLRMIQERTGVRVLDIKGRYEGVDFRYTDGLHLNLSSGREISKLLGRALRKMGVEENWD